MTEGINRGEFKLLMFIIKWFPLLLAITQFITIIFQFLDINIDILKYTCSLSLIPIIFFYLCSKVFKFCFYHRISLHYITITQLLGLYDYYIEIPITITQLFYVHVSLFIILILNLFYFLCRKKNCWKKITIC